MALNDTLIRQVKPIKPSGDKYADGGGMYLLVKPKAKYWRLDYRFQDKRKTLALGTYPEITLAKARQRRAEARELLADGKDPSQVRREDRAHRLKEANNTFEVVARLWLEKTAAERASTTQLKITRWLQNNIFPYIGKSPISDLTSRDVLLAVQKMEARGAIDSAHRVKQLCGQVFRFAVAQSLAKRDVTADLRGALASVPKRHHAAIIEPEQAAELLRSIYDYQGHPYTAAALKLSPLLFVRPGELRAMEWTEVDLETAMWRIPGDKMKMGIEHMVPLSTQAQAILRSLHLQNGHGKYVFPSLLSSERCMSDNTVNSALRRLGYDKDTMTAHGFRAMARTIMDEVLNERVDLIEHQLAHAVKDANGRAYNRTSHLPARQKMMQRWSDYLDSLREGASLQQKKK